MSNDKCFDYITILDDSGLKHISFSNKSEIVDVLENYDILYNMALDGDLDIIDTLSDFDRLLNHSVDGDNNSDDYPIIREYIDIQRGLKLVDVDLSIIDQIAKNNRRWSKTISKLLDDEIEKVAKSANDRWGQSARCNYDNNINLNDNISTHNKTSRFSEFDSEVADDVLDRGTTKSIDVSHEDYPEELLNLEEMYRSNYDRLIELREIDSRNDDERKEMNKRINMNKDLLEDIQYIKDSHNISYDTVDRPEDFNEWNTVSYNDQMDGVNVIKVGEDFSSEYSDNIKIDLIRSVAKKCLSEREHNIFKLYFFENINQKQISKIIGCNQSSISRNIDGSIKKIRKEINSL